MKLIVVGGEAPAIRRALDDLGRRGTVTSTASLPATASVAEISAAARDADAVVAGANVAAREMRVPLAALAVGRSAVLPSWSAAAHRDHLGFHDDAREVGVTLITGASAAPAVPLLLARHAAEGMSEVGAVDVAWALPPQVIAEPAMRRAVLEGMAGPALLRPDGRYRYAAPGKAMPVAFPLPVGTRPAGLFGGPEAWHLPTVVPGHPTVRVFMGGTVAWWGAALAASALLARMGQRRAAEAVTAATARITTGGRSESWAGVRVEVEGRAGTASLTQVLGGFDHLPTWDAASMVVAVETLAAGPEPGVVVAGALGGTRAHLARLYDMGIRFAAFEAAA